MKTSGLILQVLNFVMLCVCMVSCTSHHSKMECRVLNVDKAESDIQYLKLQNYSKLEFEFSKNSIIGSLAAVLPYGDMWLVQTTRRLLCFENDGRYLCDIGRYGRGPGEHLDIQSVCILDDTVAIFSAGRKIDKYVNSGSGFRFVDSKVLPANISRPVALLYADKKFPDYFFVQNLYNGTPGVTTPVLTVYDRAWNEVDTSLAVLPSGGWRISSPFTSSGDAVYHSTLACDTIHMVKDGRITPRFSFDWGESSFPKEVRGSYSRIIPYIIENPKEFRILHFRSYISEDGDFIFSLLHAAGKSILLRYDLRADKPELYAFRHADGTPAVIQYIFSSSQNIVNVVVSPPDSKEEANPSVYKIVLN